MLPPRPDREQDPWGPDEPPVPGRAAVRSSWDDEVSGPIRPGRAEERRSGVDRSAAERPAAALTAALAEEADGEAEEEVEVPFVPVRPRLSVAIGGFAGLLGLALILGAQTAGPGVRLPFAMVVFGVQLLFVLAFTMALRPPAPYTVAGVAVAVALVADVVAAVPAEASRLHQLYAFGGGVVAVVAAQLIRRVGWNRTKDALGGTVVTVGGVVALALLVDLTRRPGGTQAVFVCFAATAVALATARLTDAFFARPRVARQVPRGATGIVAGAMLGTLAASVLGSLLALPFTPGVGAVLGFVAAGLAGLVDLGANYSEAGRAMAGSAPTLWVARHMQGPLGAFALAAPVAYVLTLIFVS